jgi:hypothetical protein
MARPENARKRQELDALRRRVEELERELESGGEREVNRYYLAYYATTGFFLGMFGACTSLLFNVVGSVAVGQHPLQLIKVYLTFGLGERALSPEIDHGIVLVIGVCLYIGTGMLLGIPFQLVLTRYADRSTLATRLMIATVLSLVIWLVDFYGVISWLQPLWFGGRWILDLVPVWVAMATHLVFGWTMAIVYPWGLYQPYRLQTEGK